MKLQYKKLTATLIGVLVNFFGEAIGLDEHSRQQVTIVLVAFVVGQGVADVGKEKAKVEKGI